jgi:hypothetical protein
MEAIRDQGMPYHDHLLPHCIGVYLYERFAAEIAMLLPFKGVWDTSVNAPSGYIKDDILQLNQSFDSIASL